MKEDDGYRFSQSHIMYMAAVATAKEPNSYNVVADEQWRRTMGTEIEAKKKSKTLTIEELPLGKRAIGCQWVYKMKHHTDRTIAALASIL